MPSMVASNNRLFGGSLINQKYSPLEEITPLAAGDKDFYTNLFANRIKALSDENLFPRKLTLFATAWPAVAAGTPPMVVISSNRAEWMKQLFDNANTKSELAEFTGYNDDTTFESGPVPWYSPLRSERPVFIVVHNTEYSYYKKKLTGYDNVYVVSWRIPFPKEKFGFGVAGFGASRFAALELVKDLGYRYAWLVDDNVVNINGFPNRPATIEANMNDDIAAIGFKATTSNVTKVGKYDGTVTFATKAFDFDTQTAGLLQQVVLWNLKVLKDDDITVSPYFVSSNEDVSLTNYLRVLEYDERIITPLSIVKMQPENDKKNPGAPELANIRTKLLKLLFQKEKKTSIQKGIAAPVELEAFVTETILPNSQSPGTNVQVTQSMAIEQVLALAVSKKWAPPKIFKPYTGFQGTKVERLGG